MSVPSLTKFQWVHIIFRKKKICPGNSLKAVHDLASTFISYPSSHTDILAVLLKYPISAYPKVFACFCSLYQNLLSPNWRHLPKLHSFFFLFKHFPFLLIPSSNPSYYLTPYKLLKTVPITTYTFTILTFYCLSSLWRNSEHVTSKYVMLTYWIF